MPVHLTDVVGQGRAAHQLSSALASQRIPHALLFAGPDGVGKYRMARLLAQCLLCEAESLDPGSACGRCPSCVKLATVGHADLHVLETEDRLLKVDEVRDAMHVLQLRPLEGTLKVLVIRDADKMNPQSQNALLKTLEEPPGSSRIILTSARPQSILLTVLSRCQRVQFNEVAVEDLAELLHSRRGLDLATARLVAALSQGAPGRALEMDVEGLGSRRKLVTEIDAALEPGRPGVTAEAIDRATALAEAGEELPGLLDLYGLWLRDLMVVASSSGSALANEDLRSIVEESATRRGLPEILRRARALQQARFLLDLPYNLNPQLVLEQLCLSLSGHLTNKEIQRPTRRG